MENPNPGICRLDLALINPGGCGKIYQDLGELTAIEPPLWCRLIAGYIRDRGFSVEIIDAQAEDLTPEQVAERVDAKLVGMVVYGHQPSASTQQMSPAFDICKAIDTPIVIMGGHVSALPYRTLEEGSVDYVAVGEGVVTVDGLLRGTPLSDIPGLVWENGANPRPPLCSAKDLHGDTWDLLPMARYRSHNWQSETRQPYASIYTSLGCPYKCSFCCINAPFGGSGYRTREPDAVVAEVKYLHNEYGVKTFKIIDEMFVLKPSHYIPICDGLANLNLDLNIWAYARIDTVKPDNLDLLYQAGIRWLALGIESGSSYVRDGADKSFDDKDINNVVSQIQSAGIKVIGNFIFGLPDDTLKSMEETYQLAVKLKCDFVNFYSAMGYPGSSLYGLTAGQDLPEDWSGYSQHAYDTTPLPTATLSSAQVLQFRDNAHNKYFAGNGELTRPLKRKLLEQRTTHRL